MAYEMEELQLSVVLKSVSPKDYTFQSAKCFISQSFCM